MFRAFEDQSIWKLIAGRNTPRRDHSGQSRSWGYLISLINVLKNIAVCGNLHF